ncbi:MAG TPA: DUF3311 domain-containing protein [Nocardioidaceae bacterium]|nr:DUF3311 domain-containing protein [Nocardioidaceae bacterium]
MAQHDPAPEEQRRPKRAVNRGWYALLILPFVATLVPPFYARIEPKLGGWPFFYWWQFLWIVITSLILALVYRMTTRRDKER